MGSPLVAPPVVKPKALFCPNCGGPVEFRGFGRALTVVCPQCLTVLDASTPLLKILQQVTLQQSKDAERRTPLIPLGSRGKLRDVSWEVIGYQTRAVEADGETFEWEEYLLFNPYKGFRYLTQYNGHWNYVTPLEAQPARNPRSFRPLMSYEGRAYKHFSGAEAMTTFVLGEFPWRVKVGDKVQADDFVDPPFLLSAEKTDQEVTWSKGEYTAGAEIWKAFALPGSPPSPRGVYLNQTSPYQGTTGGIWGVLGVLLVAVLGLALFFAVFSRKEVVYHNSYRFASTEASEPSFVTRDFTLTGRPTTLEVSVDTNLNNNWAFFNFALINQDTGEAYDFGREVSYYNGSDSDGPWSEGSPGASVLLPSVPPGRYYLRVEPEMDAGQPMRYELTLRHDVPSYIWFWMVAGLLFIPPIVRTIRARNFNVERWMESDYPPLRSTSSGDSGDD